jgi:hypothetical protein
MIIHEIVIYAGAGILIAQYPKEKNLELTSAFFTAMRQFAMTELDGYGDVQKLEFMKRKIVFLHSRQWEMTFAIIVDRDDDECIVMQFFRHVRDAFTNLLIGHKNIAMYHDDSLTDDLKNIVDRTIVDFNKVSKKEKIFI